MEFKYDFFYRQYSELYCKLYAIVIQSEYVRHFLEVNDGKTITFEEAPFLEISPSHRTTTTWKIKGTSNSSVSNKTESFETPISQFNKKQLCDYIIDNGEFATQELLKLAVSYRFAYDHYSGNGTGGSPDAKETADAEEVKLIQEIVIEIVKYYNILRKELKLAFSKKELENH